MINGIPKTERIWVKRTTLKGEVYYITSEENRDFYFLYKEENGKKVRTNKKVKIDWTILATTETPEDRNNPEYILDYVTSGFSKHNFGGEVMVVGKVKNAETIANLINTFCRMMIKGEKFLPGYAHTISGADGKVQFRFNVCEYTPANGNVKYQLIPAL